MPLSTIFAICLLIWVAYDLFCGRVWLHRVYHRGTEPFAYWSTLLLWLLVAISCFYWEI